MTPDEKLIEIIEKLQVGATDIWPQLVQQEKVKGIFELVAFFILFSMVFWTGRKFMRIKYEELKFPLMIATIILSGIAFIALYSAVQHLCFSEATALKELLR